MRKFFSFDEKNRFWIRDKEISPSRITDRNIIKCMCAYFSLEDMKNLKIRAGITAGFEKDFLNKEELATCVYEMAKRQDSLDRLKKEMKNFYQDDLDKIYDCLSEKC